MAARLLDVLVLAVLPVVALLLVWQPILARSSVDGPKVTAAVVEAARQSPPDAVLDEASSFTLLDEEARPPGESVSIAEGILEGRLELPGRPPAPIHVPFSTDDLEGLPPGLRIWFAGYGVPDTLLAAYRATGREPFFEMARDAILASGSAERSPVAAPGYLWNDHATAARVRVLGAFWRAYRSRADYDPEIGRAILEQAARYRSYLADPGRFTFATNHGMMENLALLHLELAFPTLPDAAAYRALALDRLDRQLGFMLDADGFFRENSAGYQAFDARLMGMTLRVMTLLGTPVPPEWSERYRAALDVLGRLARADDTLPATGDTDGSDRESRIPVTEVDATGASGPLQPHEDRPAPADGATIDPASGAWIDWDGTATWPDAAGLRQTVMTWSQPPAPSHKHADELSLNVWAAGTAWLTSVGYWPFDDPSRADAESWSAANAPHLVGEPADSPRTVTLRGSGTTPTASAVDVERRGPGSFVARRQVVHLRPDLWLILDRLSGSGDAGYETVWTLPPGVTAHATGADGSYDLTTAGGGSARLVLTGSQGTTIRSDTGSRTPFAGWHVVGGTPLPTQALTVTQPAGDAWSLTILSTAPEASPLAVTGVPGDVDGGDDEWTVSLPTSDGDLRVTRTQENVQAVASGAGTAPAATVVLDPPPDPTAASAAIRRAFDAMAAAFPQFQERASARVRVSAVLVLLAMGQLVGYLVIRRARPRLLMPFRLLALGCWIGLALALPTVILRSWEVVRLGAG